MAFFDIYDTNVSLPANEIDACMFSGDSFLDPDVRVAFRKILERWSRGLDSFDEDENESPDSSTASGCTEYKVIRYNPQTEVSVSEQVTKHLSTGWRLYGDPFPLNGSPCQTMVR